LEQSSHEAGGIRREQMGPAALLAAIVNSSDDAIIGKTQDGVITTWNPAAERMYGYAAAEIIGQPIAVLCPPDRVAEVTEILRKIGNGERVLYHETVRQRKTELPSRYL
jgi:PAS domain S-box-containing protein